MNLPNLLYVKQFLKCWMVINMDVVVIGGGASGMMASIISARENNKVVLLEKTSSLGNKLKITGKGRCNITFEGDIDDFMKNVVKNNKFMYSSFSNFDNKDVVNFFNSLGVNTKVERGKRVFPVSDDAKEVVNALEKELKKCNVDVKYNSTVNRLGIKNNKIEYVETVDNKVYKCDKCIIATGGKSYKSTGSTGDGYTLCQKIGHDITDIKAGLVPLKSNDIICKQLQGLSLRNISIKLLDNNKIIYEDFGEMMFSHFGLTGPTILSASSKLNRLKDIEKKLNENDIKVSIDLKPALDIKTLDKRICRDFEKYSNKEFKNSLNELLPKKLIPVIIDLSKIDENKKVHQITAKERNDLCQLIKNFKINISGFMPIDIAIITSGGVNVSKINPKNMESKLVKGVHIVGELLDVDAYTGGYNLQIAFSTAVAAGKNNIY